MIEEVAANPQVRNYKFYQTIEAGLVLQGWEVKSIRLFKASLRGTRIVLTPRGGWLEGLKLQPYKYARVTLEMRQQPRRLLLNKKEILYLLTKVKEGYFLIPSRLYWRGKKLKLEIGVGRKLSKWRKKERLKEKDLKRQTKFELSYS